MRKRPLSLFLVAKKRKKIIYGKHWSPGGVWGAAGLAGAQLSVTWKAARRRRGRRSIFGLVFNG